MILTSFVLVNLTEIQGITSCWLSFSSLSSGDPTHLLTLFGHRGVKMAWRSQGGVRPNMQLEFIQFQPCSRWVRSIPEGNCVVPRGVRTTAIGKSRPASMRRRCKSSRKKKSPQMVYEASEGGVETSAKRKKANPLTF